MDAVHGVIAPVISSHVTTDLLVNLAGASTVLAAAFGSVPTNIFAVAVEAAGDEQHSGMAMAMIMMGQNGGMLLGPVIFGTLADAAGWTAAFASLAVLAALGFLAGWLAKVR